MFLTYVINQHIYISKHIQSHKCDKHIYISKHIQSHKCDALLLVYLQVQTVHHQQNMRNISKYQDLLLVNTFPHATSVEKYDYVTYCLYCIIKIS